MIVNNNNLIFILFYFSYINGVAYCNITNYRIPRHGNRWNSVYNVRWIRNFNV